MKLLFDSDSLSIEYNEDKSLIRVVGKKESIKVPIELGRKAFLAVAEKVIELKPDLLLVNDWERTYVYAVEEQKWVAKVFIEACIEGGLKKMAFINPEGLIQELSTIQVFDEAGELPFEFRNVKSETEAYEWFK